MGWSQSELATRAGISTSMMCRLESGVAWWRAGHMEVVAHALGVPAFLLLTDSADPDGNQWAQGYREGYRYAEAVTAHALTLARRIHLNRGPSGLFKQA